MTLVSGLGVKMVHPFTSRGNTVVFARAGVAAKKTNSRQRNAKLTIESSSLNIGRIKIHDSRLSEHFSNVRNQSRALVELTGTRCRKQHRSLDSPFRSHKRQIVGGILLSGMATNIRHATKLPLNT
jgi:hypothetical protein